MVELRENGDGGAPASAGEPAGVDDSSLLMDVVRAVLVRAGAEAWEVEPGDFWCSLTPPGHRMLAQGWKLHVSATILAAPVVLARAAKVLVDGCCAFKFARGLDQLDELLSGLCDRGGGGKFLTAYPADDERFRRMAAALDRVTDGLPGPVVLSDRPLRPGSLVSYRFGVFDAPPVFGNDGSFESVLVGPDGRQEKDQRQAWFSAPDWAVSPMPTPPAARAPSAGHAPSASGVAPDGPPPVLIGGRFVVREAIRHSYKGGVFRATDRQTGEDVILKQARAHVESGLTGTDVRDGLRHEAEMLDLLAPSGLTPRAVALVPYQENLYLAQELVPGVTLRRWAADRAMGTWQSKGAPPAQAVGKARRLVEIMAALHGRGLVIRDFTPNNVMVTPDDRLRLIDLEHVVPAGSRVLRAYTPGYAGAEQRSGPRFGPAPSQGADLFGLGATIVYLASGIDPLLPDDDPVERSGQERIETLITLIGASMPAVRRLAPMILGLVHDDPDQRWNLGRAHDFLAVETPAPAAGPEDERLPAPEADRLLADGLRHVLRAMTPDGPRLWSTGAYGDSTDPCNVQHGAAGVLSVLTRSARALGDEHLRDGVAKTAGWIHQRLFDIPEILPGLYFGRSGTAWALYDAARFLDDEEMAEQAVKLAKRVPVEWPNPDVCHGAAGAGMAQLKLWRATGDPALKVRGIQAADHVLGAARERDGLLVWPIPETFESDLAGLVHYGFAHGVAGAGAFLLYAGLATGRSEYAEAALRAGETLRAVAEVKGRGAWWPRGEDDGAEPTRMRHWCSGSSGVGTFLIRLWLGTGERRFRELAEAAGAAVHRERWYSTTATCHGLAGDGDFLLDLAEFTGERRYHDWAGELAAVMHARHSIRDGLMVVPDETGTGIGCGYGTGLSGAASFLLRLRHGGPRPWMLDGFLTSTAPGADAGRPYGTERP